MSNNPNHSNYPSQVPAGTPMPQGFSYCSLFESENYGYVGTPYYYTLVPQMGSQTMAPTPTPSSSTRGPNPWNGKNVNEINGFVPKNQQTNSFSNTAMPYSPVSFNQPNGNPAQPPTQYVTLPPNSSLRIMPRMAMVSSPGTTGTTMKGVTPSMGKMNGVTPPMKMNGVIPPMGKMNGVTPSMTNVNGVPGQPSPVSAPATVPQTQSKTPLGTTPGFQQAPAKTSPAVSSTTPAAPAAPASPPHTVMNLKPNSRSRRSSITERSTQITTERLSELNKDYKDWGKQVYVPAAMTELWNCVREKMTPEVIYKLTQEEVNCYKWNISIVSKNNAHGLLGDAQAILNKLTLETFDVLYEKFLNLSPSSLDEYSQLVDLVYEKAVMEPHFAPMYAKLCRLMNRDSAGKLNNLLYSKPENGLFVICARGTSTPLTEGMKTEELAREAALKQTSFRRILADKCQRELETEGKTVELEAQRRALKEKLRGLSEGPEFVQVTSELMEVEFKINTIRRRTFGNVLFIGELFNCGLLRFHAVIKACFDHLITPPESADDEKTEALCKLLTTVGRTMCDNQRFADVLEDTMMKVNDLAESPVLTSRVRFALKDLLELASNMWVVEDKEKLEKLSDIRMRKTIEKLMTVIEQLEKKNGIRHDKSSSRHSRVIEEESIDMATVGSEVIVDGYDPSRQFKQEEMSSFQRSIVTGLNETKASRDYEDFKYNVETKKAELKKSDCVLLSAALMNYACENLKLDSPDMTLFISSLDYLFETDFISNKDFIQGFLSALQSIDYMDSPNKYAVGKKIFAALVDKKRIVGDDLDKALNAACEVDSLSYSAKQFI